VKQHLTAFNKAIGFISASIEQVTGITKPQKKFLTWLFEKWIMLPVRHNFLNIYRYGNGGYSEKSIRHQVPVANKRTLLGVFRSRIIDFEKLVAKGVYRKSTLTKSMVR